MSTLRSRVGYDSSDPGAFLGQAMLTAAVIIEIASLWMKTAAVTEAPWLLVVAAPAVIYVCGMILWMALAVVYLTAFAVLAYFGAVRVRPGL